MKRAIFYILLLVAVGAGSWFWAAHQTRQVFSACLERAEARQGLIISMTCAKCGKEWPERELWTPASIHGALKLVCPACEKKLQARDKWEGGKR